MTAITDALVAEARHACPIEDVVAAAGVTLWRTAGGPLKGLCPFHDEQAPSLTVRPERGLWYCFMYCDGGDVVKFVERIRGVTFPEAVAILAGQPEGSEEGQ